MSDTMKKHEPGFAWSWPSTNVCMNTVAASMPKYVTSPKTLIRMLHGALTPSDPGCGPTTGWQSTEVALNVAGGSRVKNVWIVLMSTGMPFHTATEIGR